MRNPLVNEAAEVINAVAALRLKPTARVVSTSRGIEVHQPTKPVLLLTYEAAAEFARQWEE